MYSIVYSICTKYVYMLSYKSIINRILCYIPQFYYKILYESITCSMLYSIVILYLVSWVVSETREFDTLGHPNQAGSIRGS